MTNDSIRDIDVKSLNNPRREIEKRNDLEKQGKRRHDMANSGEIVDENDADDSERLLGRTNETVTGKSIENIIVTSSLRSFCWKSESSSASKTWFEQLRQQETSGLFVEEEKALLRRVKQSTLDRLEERFSRELVPVASSHLRQKNSELLIQKLLVSDMPTKASSFENSLAANDVVGNGSTSFPRDNVNESHKNQKKTRNFAMLQLFVDRVVLDDHPSFTLTDCLAAQMRALCMAYSRMQHLQPWQLSLQRLDGYFPCSDKSGMSNRTMVVMSDLQVVQEVNQLLTDLEALTKLHQQILSKANEMRDAASRAGSVFSLSIHQMRRKHSIDLSRVDAVLLLLASSHDNQQDEVHGHQDDTFHLTLKQIAQHLSNVSTASVQARETVLQIKFNNSENKPPSHWSPTFYIVLQINGKIACSTKDQALSRGQVVFSEKLRFELPFFPSSVCATIYERRRFWRDRLLSTNAIPVIVPGQNDLKRNVQSKSLPSLFSGWKENEANALIRAASLTPSDEWYQFSCTSFIQRTQWHPTFHNAPLFAHTSRRIHGRLHLLTSWTTATFESPNGTQDPAYLPPRRAKTAGMFQSPERLVGKSLDRRYLSASGFQNERDFLQIIESGNLPLDPNDPENVAVRRLQNYLMQQQEAGRMGLKNRKVFRTSDVPELLIGSGFGLTKRNRLLQLRDREFASRRDTSCCEATAKKKMESPLWTSQHEVFDEPLPLLDRELVADERLLRLLRPELHAFDRRLLWEEAERADASILEQHRVRYLIKLEDFHERIRQTQSTGRSNANLVTNNQKNGRVLSKPLAAIVQEKPLPLFPGMFELPAIGAFFASRRRLRPRSKVSSTASAAAYWPTSCTLYVQVQKAANVPVRIQPAHNGAKAGVKRRRGTLHRTTKSSRLMPPTSDKQRKFETLYGGKLEYESNVFVRIAFQKTTRQTSCTTVRGSVGKETSGVGVHPVWMETIALPFCPPQDEWSPEGIASTNDTIRFTLFDQVTRPAENNDQERDDERVGGQTRTLHRENCYLGSLEVPFLTLYRAGRLEASLRCEMPAEHLGYICPQIATDVVDTSIGALSEVTSGSEAGTPRPGRQEPNALTSRSTEKRRSMRRSPETSSVHEHDERVERGVEKVAREATYLSVTMLLDPPLPVGNLTRDLDGKKAPVFSVTDTQTRLLDARARHWVASARSFAPKNAARHRNFSVFVRTLSHGVTFLTQFLQAQPPPLELQSTSLSSLVHYVSLIPFLDDRVAFDQGVWSSTQEFLDLGAGYYEEHAMLLANYFMWYDRRNDEDHKLSRIYLVLGYAIPEGPIVYVLRRGVLWNARTGAGFLIFDPHCPLYDVSLVVSSENVFANVQPVADASTGRSQEFNWDIERNPECWKPFFTERSVSLPPTIQSRQLLYSETKPNYVGQVERELREALKLAIRRWRSTHFTTTFNEASGLQLREHLMVLERDVTEQYSRNNMSLTDETMSLTQQELKTKLAFPMQRTHRVLHEQQRSKEVCGFPIHLTFTDISRVLDVVESAVRVFLLLM